MKRAKRVLSLVLAMMLALGMSMTAFAAETTAAEVATAKGDGNFSITLTHVKSGHTYTAYQVFQGDLLEIVETNEDGEEIVTGKKLSNIEWGNGVDADALLTALKADETLADIMKDAETAADVAEALEGKEDDGEVMQAFADVVAKHLTAAAGSSSGSEEKTDGDGTVSYLYTIENLTAGYYLVKDTTTALGDHDAYTRYILQVVSDVEMEVKAEVPELEKKILEGELKVDANTAGLGKVVSYEITGAVPDHTGYDTYFYVINDTLSKGLTFNEDVKVMVDGVELTAGTDYYLYTGDQADGYTFRVAFADITEYGIGKSVVVTYSATVNGDAVIGEAGNPNTVTLTYSHDPNSDQGGEKIPGIPDENVPTGETPEDKTITYVAEIDILKTKEDGTIPLAGAEFTLTGTSTQTVLVDRVYYELAEDGTYYLLKDGTYTETAPQEEVTDEDGNVVTESNEHLYTSTTAVYKKVTATETQKVETQVEMTAVSDENGKLSFGGLGAGTYVIEETKVPAGYNKAEDVTVVIVCKVPDTVADGKETATWSLGDGTSDGVTLNGALDGENAAASGIYETVIVNKEGAVLPSTGGMGTTLFYVIGSLLVLAAVVILVTRRRMKNAA